MADQRASWIWTLLRKKTRKELDQMERELIVRPAEKRRYAGDPNQPQHFWVRTRNK